MRRTPICRDEPFWGEGVLAGLEAESTTESDHGEIVGWRLKELKQAGYDDTAALAIALNLEIDLHLAVDLPIRGCPPALAARILL